jgi:hypothetical protein
VEASTTKAAARVWFVIWAAGAAAPIIYGVVTLFTAAGVMVSPELPTLRLALYAFGLVDLVAGGFLITRAPRMRSDVSGFAAFMGGDALAEPFAFQRGFILGMSLVQSCAVFGFVFTFLGGRPLEYVPFGAGALAVMVAVGLPVGRNYWSERERLDSGDSGPIE